MQSFHRYVHSFFIPPLRRSAKVGFIALILRGTSALLMSTLLLPVSGNAASKATAGTAALRVSCEDADVGAEVYINEKFKGECPVDIMLSEGSHKIRVVKKIDSSHERAFEQEFRLADGTAKKIVVALGGSRLSEEGRKMAEKANQERRKKMEDLWHKVIGTARSGDAEAKDVIARNYMADAKGCFVSTPYPGDDTSITWSGQCRDGVASGRGELQWFSKSQKVGQFTGEMVAGRFDGRGIEFGMFGRYEGDFAAGRRQGYGTMLFNNGDRYEGDWVVGRRTGYGKLVLPNGAHYEGNWLDNFMDGDGVYVWPDGGRYEGGFVKNNRTGHGVVIFKDGTREEGQYLNGVLTN